MKKILALAAALMLAASAVAAGKPDLSKYVIVYSAAAEAEEGIEAAEALSAALVKAGGPLLAIVPDTEPEARREILVGNTSRKASAKFYAGKPDTFDWYLGAAGNKVVAAGGGCWALERAVNTLAEAGVPRKPLKGNIYGEFLFPREAGANLRILDDNIWDYGKPANTPEWEALGADCRDEVRVHGLVELVWAYLPDVFTMQEYSAHMDALMRPLLEERGYRMAYIPGEVWNHTPIFYNPEAVTLKSVKYHKYEPAAWSNKGSKSYCSALFTLNATGKDFFVINTHLWWKSEKNQPGSDEARTAQVRKMMTEADDAVLAHGCPVFMMGDMNCKLESKAMKQLLAAGYRPAVWEASVYGDPRNGYHSCTAKTFSRDCSWTDENGLGAIDQFFIYNADGAIAPPDAKPAGEPAQILVFRRIYAAFTVLLTDHYPNYADIRL